MRKKSLRPNVMAQINFAFDIFFVSLSRSVFYSPLFGLENCLLTSKPITLHTLVKYSFQLQVIEIEYFESFREIISIS